jgi:O-antigen ligase
MSRSRAFRMQGDALRCVILALLVAAPLALSSFYAWAYVPMLIVSAGAGIVAWARGHWARAHGADVPRVPGRGLLLALHALVLAQLVPLPPAVLKRVSPGTAAFHEHYDLALVPVWAPITVNPGDTVRGFCFLAGLSLLYTAVYREFRDGRWRRRLAGAVVGTGLVMTFVALVQAASGTTQPYGLWHIYEDWAVFGPYLNRNHFAGYLVMALPLALAFTQEALGELRRSWRRRRVGWLALGERAGNAFIRRAAEAMVLVVGLLASGSRGGMMACVVSLAVVPLALGRRRRQAALVIAVIVLLGASWVGIGRQLQGFESRGIRASRLELWEDAAQLVPRFPVFGVGLNGFTTAYPQYQTFWKSYWIGEAHNEYLQVLLDLGVVGAALAIALLATLFRAAIRTAGRTPLDAGVFGCLLALCAHNLVDFNWQIPANAATWVAVAGLAMRRAGLPATSAEDRSEEDAQVDVVA